MHGENLKLMAMIRRAR